MTIRELMLAQQARHYCWTHPATKRQWCPRCDEVWPCADRVAADAVIDALGALIRVPHDLNDREADGSYSVLLRTGTPVAMFDGEDEDEDSGHLVEEGLFVKVVPDPGVS